MIQRKTSGVSDFASTSFDQFLVVLKCEHMGGACVTGFVFLKDHICRILLYWLSYF